MKKTMFAIIAIAILGITACNQSPKATNTDSQVVQEQYAAEDGEKLDACSHSTKIYWKGTKPGGEHNGIIKLKEGGKFIVEDEKLVGGEFIIDMNSIVDLDIEDEEMNGKLVGHLKSPDFFMVDSFPEAKFVITQISDLSGSDVFNATISGNLTIKDITQPISFNAKVIVNEGMVTAMSEDIVLDRTKWGVNYQSKSIFKELKDKFISDEFTVKIEAHSM